MQGDCSRDWCVAPGQEFATCQATAGCWAQRDLTGSSQERWPGTCSRRGRPVTLSRIFPSFGPSAILLSQPLGLRLLRRLFSPFQVASCPSQLPALSRLWAPLIGAALAAETGWDAPGCAAQEAPSLHLFPRQQGRGLWDLRELRGH